MDDVITFSLDLKTDRPVALPWSPKATRVFLWNRTTDATFYIGGRGKDSPSIGRGFTLPKQGHWNIEIDHKHINNPSEISVISDKLDRSVEGILYYG